MTVKFIEPKRVKFPLFELVSNPIIASRCPVCKHMIWKDMNSHIEEQMDIEHIIYRIYTS